MLLMNGARLTHPPNMGGYGPSKAAARSLSAGVRAELAEQGTQVIALIVGSVDTRMAAHVEGAKESPEDIARAGLKAVKHGLDELDTDRMAIEIRAALALDPKGLERRMARLLNVDGYEILTLSRNENRIELNVVKLKRQFDLE